MLFAPWIIGLDIGQVYDPAALTIVEREQVRTAWDMQPRYQARHLERFPLGTGYTEMCAHAVKYGAPCGGCGGASKGGLVEQVEAYLKRLPVPVGWEWQGGTNPPYRLLIDATGVGRPIVETFRHRGLAAIAVVLHAGDRVTQHAWNDYTVPKRVLIGALQVALQTGRFRVAKALPDAAVLVKEALNFQYKLTPAGHDMYGAWREGQHDDLLLSAALTVWYGEATKPHPAGRAGTLQATGPGDPLQKFRHVPPQPWVSNPFARSA
jgi:hypothetical protein